MCAACCMRQYRSSFLSNLRSNGVNDVVPLLFTDSAMCSGVIGDQTKPKDRPETTHTPCEKKNKHFSAQKITIFVRSKFVKKDNSYYLHFIFLFVVFALKICHDLLMFVLECFLAHHICRRQQASLKSGRCNRWVAVQKMLQSWTPVRIWSWDESAPGAEPSGPTLPSWQGTSRPWRNTARGHQMDRDK